MRRIVIPSILLSPLFLSAAALAIQPSTDAPASTPARPLSTGVKPAHVLSTPDIALTPTQSESLPFGAQVVLTLNVDENGKAQNVEVVKSPNQFLDQPVADAIRETRFSPATLDRQPVATPMTLTVLVRH
jgi:TonB family protein